MKITIDKAGRVVLPKAVRDDYGLTPGTVLDIEEAGEVIVLRPRVEQPNVREKEGLLVIAAEFSADLADAVKDSREDRIAGFAAYASGDKGRE